MSQPILIVEDSPEDYEALERAFRSPGMKNPLFRCEDGDEALDFLFRRGAYTDPERAPRPGLMLLDLNMPGTDGRDVLREIKAAPDLKIIPVVVMTTSADERDIDDCYDFGANSYVVKPVDLGKFVEAVQRLRDYWFEIVVLPKH